MSDTVALVVVLAISGTVIGSALVFGRRMRAEQPGQWIVRHRYPLALVIAGAVIALTGVGMIVHARLVSTVVVDLAAAEAGGEIDGAFVEVEGYARPEASICRGSDCYTPVTSSADGRRVAVLFGGPTPPAGAGRWSGFVTRTDQRGFRSRVEEAGLEPVAELVRILPESKEERSAAGSWVALSGLVLFVAGAIWFRR